MTYRESRSVPLESKFELPPLKNVIILQIISLIIILILGILFFLLRTPTIYYLIGIFLTGPIYAINIPYLIRYIDFTEDHVSEKINELKNEVKSSSISNDHDLNQNSKYIAKQYAITKADSNFVERKISKKIITILSITPIWPIVVYYTLFNISKNISIHEEIRVNIFSKMSEDKTKQEFERYSDKLFQATSKHKVFFLVFSGISIFGFALTFSLIAVGFFAPFWIILLHNRLSRYSDENIDRSRPSQKKQDGKFITVTTVAAFLCFGATSGFIAAISNTIYASLIAPIGLVSPTLFILFLVTFIAPLTEEPSKVAGFFLLDKDKARNIPLFYWAFFGMIAGLGFALIENYSYFQQFFVMYSTRDSLYLLLMRFSMPVHLIGSALGGIGVGLWRKRKSIFYLGLFIVLAMIVHGSYNFIVTIGSV